MFIFKLESFLYIRSLFFIFIIDTLLIDDEPLWEPLEWSLVQTWLLFIYIFTWASEVIFSTKYGSYSNRDKTVWIGLFKVYWFITLWFMFNLFITAVFITIPFYFEITYPVSYIVIWWNWYNSLFFFKIILLLTIIYLLLYFFLLYYRWILYDFIFILFIFILFIFIYLFLYLFILTFYGFFTDQLLFKNTSWFSNNNTNNFLKWDWGLKTRDHFAYHRTVSVFWFKNDPLVSATMLFFNLFIFFSLFFLILKVLIIIRILYTTKELSFNLFLFFFSTIKLFYIFLLLLYIFVILSIFYHLLRFPFEFFWFNKLFLVIYLIFNFYIDLFF